ncbi:neuraminidase [Delitschia confertaspora ATCC 74209]|uniref:Neuraminidase n=1 Tax=Delitschia confertaspora ATCC 74209 TaxID=1513339 RepID=A0A9P4MKS0_9PLEO|nr:neuraminidase [Delitschia confertaspora ATCC 74209]
MKLSTTLLYIPLFGLTFASPKPHAPPSTFSRVTVYTPPSNYTDPRVLYARTAQLPNGDLLATWENYSPEPPPVYFPIYRSTDNGYTWKELSRVQDKGYGWGLRYQPFLYVLPEEIGGFPKGTVLLSGSSIPTDLSKTQIDLYASRDEGRSWEFVSHIAAGGRAVPDNGLTPVWEPFLMVWQKTLICYYSDQRDNATHGQKMVHQTSRDLKTWGAVIDDVAYPRYTDRPGMPTVAELPNGKFIMTYEYGGGQTSGSYSFPVFFKIVSDPEKFGPATGRGIKATDGTIPNGSPYVVWSPAGGKNGTIIVSSSSHSEVFINTQLGEGSWKKVATPEGTSYTRHLRMLNDGHLLIMGGGKLPPSTTNKVTVTVMDVPK